MRRVLLMFLIYGCFSSDSENLMAIICFFIFALSLCPASFYKKPRHVWNDLCAQQQAAVSLYSFSLSFYISENRFKPIRDFYFRSVEGYSFFRSHCLFERHLIFSFHQAWEICVGVRLINRVRIFGQDLE